VLTQISSVTAALDAVALGLVHEHLRHCVMDAVLEAGAERDRKLHEAVEHCVSGVSAGLAKLGGVHEVDVDLDWQGHRHQRRRPRSRRREGRGRRSRLRAREMTKAV